MPTGTVTSRRPSAGNDETTAHDQGRHNKAGERALYIPMRLQRLPQIIATLCMAGCLQACMEDDSFTTSPANTLTFSTDTVRLDTTFSNVPTTTRTLWVYNRSGDGIRCSTVRLENGNQTGFRVNVNGTYLGESSGYQAQQVEIRKKDSVRVFVELTAPATQQQDPQLVSDNLVFTLESGVEQRVNLRAYAWDATLMSSPSIEHDTTLTGEKPIVVRGTMTVEEGATLTLAAGTTLYFHQDAGIDVSGTLRSEGEQGKEVTLRGDRLDRMFDYLPYDHTPGLWQGICFQNSSYGNELDYTDLHSAYTGITCESDDTTKDKLTMRRSTVHNCQGYGVKASNAKVTLENCLFSNTLSDCAAFYGGDISINGCTFAQFYPFDIDRGAALYFSGTLYPLLSLSCRNSLITGYADDVMTGVKGADESGFTYLFENCVIRTPQVAAEEEANFVDIIYEDVTDTERFGEKNFVRIDTELLRYDFHLSEVSPAIDAANPQTAPATDRDGRQRDSSPDVGCYEREK